jgi:uncharacterized membrane protein YphA (DoxX/SURF4 family)
MVDLLFTGWGWTDIALLSNRLAVGTFFMISGYHKLFNSPRHQIFVDELRSLRVPVLRLNQWSVPIFEFLGGVAVLIGFMTSLAALALLVIILIAVATSGRLRLKSYQPIDLADRIDDWLYLPETLYAFMLLLVIAFGAGRYSVDSWIVSAIDRGGHATGTPH